ncbi:MAG: glycosyltransferase, partial [Albidovulum sp.]|nr:glycosyltransferase [Albidovulum sp.]
MSAPISIVVPTRNAASQIGGTLASLYEGIDAGLIRDLVISDGDSVDEIAEIADDVGAVLIRGRAGRGTQLAAGAKAAKGDWLLFLHADTRLSGGWTADAAEHMANSPEMAAYFKLEFNSDSVAAKAVAAWANFRSRAFDLPYGDQGLLLSRKLYDSIGGYPPIPIMEDVVVAKRLRGQLLMLNGKAKTDASHYV